MPHISLLIAPFELVQLHAHGLGRLSCASARQRADWQLLLLRTDESGRCALARGDAGSGVGFLYAGYYSLAALSLGGFLTGALVAGSAGLVARFRPKRPEVSLAAFYLVSLALGVIIVSARGSNVDLMHVLFGTVLAVDMRNLLFIAIISSAALLVLAAIYRPLAIDSFDPAFLRSVGAGGGVYPGRLSADRRP